MCFACMLGTALVAGASWIGAALAAFRRRSKREAAMAAIESEGRVDHG